MPQVGHEAFCDACNDLKPAQKKSVLAIIDKYSGGTLSLAVAPAEPAAEAPAPSAARTRPSASTKRPATSAGLRRPAAEAAKPAPAAPEESSDAVVSMSNGKEKRAKKDKIQKWDPDTKSKDTQAGLKDEMSHCIAEDAVKLLFGPTWEKHCQGLDLLLRALDGHFAEMMSIMDLLLKYSSLRICEGNTNTMNKIDMLCTGMFAEMAEQGIQLTAHEAQPAQALTPNPKRRYSLNLFRKMPSELV